MRHAFEILRELGAECDRLGVRVVDVYGERGPASEFLAQIVAYIEAREAECDRLLAASDPSYSASGQFLENGKRRRSTGKAPHR